jgi:hypothetical protein
MKHLIKDYLKDLRGMLLLCLGFSSILSAGIILGGLLYGQPPGREVKIGLVSVAGLLAVGGVLAVTADHLGTWNSIRSEHFAPLSVESMDMDRLHERIGDVQSDDKT